LRNPEQLTYLKEGYDNVEFAFPNLDGKMTSLNDSRFKNKVVILQIMGSWCPNCLDESKFFSEFYNNNKNKDLEIIALAFENAKTDERAIANLNRLKDRLGISYEILLAQVGSSSKLKAAEKLPMLNHILSYPTSIFIDKKGMSTIKATQL
jgi:thiol-disulfide isomerase/thioredoxin